VHISELILAAIRGRTVNRNMVKIWLMVQSTKTYY
jgi:hypothetical protein